MVAPQISHVDLFKNKFVSENKIAESLVQVMDQRFSHLINTRPKQGRRMIGLGAKALWDLWQRVSKLDHAAQ